MSRYVWAFFLLVCSCLQAQESVSSKYVPPFDFKLLLSANFGELRANHFHGGLDFKTKGVENQPVMSIASGYVSRITVSAGGYGYALYITHPDGTTAVYGHLNRFRSDIARYVESYQYEHETFVVDLDCTSRQFPVEQGEVIGLSGNTGYSFGPHLHMEIRRTDTQEALNPLPYYIKQIKDTRPPKASSLTFYAYPGEGVLQGAAHRRTLPVLSPGKGNCLRSPVQAWGKIGFGISANDYMDETSNVYGVRSVTLYQDTVILFKSVMDSFPMSESRAINAWTDYSAYVSRNQWIMKSFVSPSNRLPMLSAADGGGWVSINEEKTYDFTYVLEDFHGNRSDFHFTVQGCRMDIPQPVLEGRKPLAGNRTNVVQEAGMQLTIPRGMLYEDVNLFTKVSADTSAVSFEYTLHDEPLPFHGYCELLIGIHRPVESDSLRYYIQRRVGNRYVSVGGKYVGGWVKAAIRQGGTYRVAIDNKPPLLKPLGSTASLLRYKVHDGETGLKSWRGTVDGKFVLVAYSAKNGILSCRLDRDRIPVGKHRFELAVTDYAGNVTTVTKIINL